MQGVELFSGIIAPYVNFIIFALLAYKFFKKPLINMVQKRRAEYEQLLKEAGLAKDQALQKNAELSEKMAALDKEIATIKSNAEKSATLEAEKIIDQASQLAGHLEAEAGRISSAEVKKARDELRAEIVAEVTGQVSTKLANELNEQSHLKIVESDLGRVKEIRVEV